MNRYAYAELRAAALAADATQEDVNALGEWFAEYGNRYWNGFTAFLSRKAATKFLYVRGAA